LGTLVGTPFNGYENSSADATISGTYGTAVQIGDVAIVFLGGYHDTATVSSVTSSIVAGGFAVASALQRTIAGTGPAPFLVAYVGVVTTAGTLVVDTTMSAAYGDKRLSIYVERGLDTTTPILGNAGATGLDQSAETGSVVTDSTATVIAALQEWSWATAHAQNTGTPATGWTEWGDTATGSDNKYQSLVAGTYNGNFTWTSADEAWSAIVIATRDAAAGGSILLLVATDMASPVDMQDMRG
jgi:hypothetical protein